MRPPRPPLGEGELAVRPSPLETATRFICLHCSTRWPPTQGGCQEKALARAVRGKEGLGRQAGGAGSVRDVPEEGAVGRGMGRGREAEGVCQTAREMAGHNIQSEEGGGGWRGGRWVETGRDGEMRAR